jgi:hypothetical protein
MTTALEYAASFGRRKPNPAEVTELHRLREQDLAALASKDIITIDDIQVLEWGVKFAVANELFDKCDAAAKHALLHDQHHGVRAAATLFKPTEKLARQVLPPVKPAAAPVAPATIAQVAAIIMNGKQRMATLQGLKTAAGIEEMIGWTHPTALLERVEAFIVGFEGDETQEGIDQLLADLRAARKPT